MPTYDGFKKQAILLVHYHLVALELASPYYYNSINAVHNESLPLDNPAQLCDASSDRSQKGVHSKIQVHSAEYNFFSVSPP